MMALLFLWAAGWLPLQASAPEAEGGRARGAGDRHSADLADTDRRRPSMTSQTAAPSPANAGNPTEPAPAAKSAIVTTTSRKQAKLRRAEERAAEPAAEADAAMRAGSNARNGAGRPSDPHPVPKRHWRTYGNNYPLPTGAEALDEPFAAFPSWFMRVTCERCGKEVCIPRRCDFIR